MPNLPHLKKHSTKVPTVAVHQRVSKRQSGKYLEVAGVGVRQSISAADNLKNGKCSC